MAIAEKLVKLQSLDNEFFDMERAEKLVKLQSLDNEFFNVEKAVAFQSQLLKNVIEDTDIDQPILLPKVSSNILAKIIQYCKEHVKDASNNQPDNILPCNNSNDNKVEGWDVEFLKVDQITLFDLILAADYLNIKNLLHTTCMRAIQMMEKAFNNKEIDFEIEDEDKVRQVYVLLENYGFKVSCTTTHAMEGNAKLV